MPDAQRAVDAPEPSADAFEIEGAGESELPDPVARVAAHPQAAAEQCDARVREIGVSLGLGGAGFGRQVVADGGLAGKGQREQIDVDALAAHRSNPTLNPPSAPLDASAKKRR